MIILLGTCQGIFDMSDPAVEIYQELIEDVDILTTLLPWSIEQTHRQDRHTICLETNCPEKLVGFVWCLFRVLEKFSHSVINVY